MCAVTDGVCEANHELRVSHLYVVLGWTRTHCANAFIKMRKLKMDSKSIKIDDIKLIALLSCWSGYSLPGDYYYYFSAYIIPMKVSIFDHLKKDRTAESFKVFYGGK